MSAWIDACGAPLCDKEHMTVTPNGVQLRTGMGAAVENAPLVGEAPPSPAGPLDDGAAHLLQPPLVGLSRPLTILRFNQRQIQLVFRARRELGEVFRIRGATDDAFTITSHPDHVHSLFTAKPEQAPPVTGESPLRPVVGPNSVLTADRPRRPGPR